MATSSGDIQDIVSKLSSDKAKTREEGIRLLNSWLDGDRSIGFCRLLGRNTERLKQDDIPYAETWPFFVTLLTKCVAMEISSSKKKFPNKVFAKTLKIVIQHAEDFKSSEKSSPLLPVIKPLFNHIWDVIRDVPSFQSEYGTIVRKLLTVKEYRFHMGKQVYCSLVLSHISKVEAAISEKGSIMSNAKNEIFRMVLTLHSLLENPAGDFPHTLRDGLVEGFISIFSHVKKKEETSRKLVDCLNTFLLLDGPNLGSKALRIHYALQDFILSNWLTIHHGAFKSAFVLYARIQLKLSKNHDEGDPLVRQFFDVIVKELDQTSTSVVGATRDDKSGTLAGWQRGLMELAASVVYQACICENHGPSAKKRSKRENVADCVKEGLRKGKWLWYGTFYSLIEKYGSCISKPLLLLWFDGICENFERILNDGYNLHAYDGLLWVLRALQGLSSLNGELFKCMSSQEVGSGWHVIWSCLMHWLPVFGNVASLADAAFLVLSNIMLNDLIKLPIVPQDVWDLQTFKRTPSLGASYFIAQYFIKEGIQGDLRDILHLRQSLLKSVLGSFNFKEACNGDVVMALPAAIFSLSAGHAILPPRLHGSSILRTHINLPEFRDDWVVVDEHEQRLADELFDCSTEVLSEIYPRLQVAASEPLCNHGLRLPRLIRHQLMSEVEDWLLVNFDLEIDNLPLRDLLLFSAFLSTSIHCLILIRQQGTSVCFTKIYNHLVKFLERTVSVINDYHSQLEISMCGGLMHVLDTMTSIASSLQLFADCPLFSLWKTDHELLPSDIIQVIERILMSLTKLFEKISHFAENIQLEEFFSSLVGNDDSQPVHVGKASVVDVDLDAAVDSKDKILPVRGRRLSGIPFVSARLKVDIVLAITKFSNIVPVVATSILFELMGKEHDPEVRKCIIRCLCENCACSSIERLPELVESISLLVKASLNRKYSSSEVLTCIHCLLEILVASDSNQQNENAVYTLGEQNFAILGDVLTNLADTGRLDWAARVTLVDCICCFIMLVPQIGQGMIQTLLAMIQDADYRVRVFLARRIGVLFQTWDGHHELFQDICSNFGVKIIMASKEKLVNASEVLAAGTQSCLAMETAILTLGHVAFISEKVELEAIFMMCTVAATDPPLRELIYALLDNLSKRLNYDSRAKYLDELMGSIIFCWIASGVSLAAFVEVRELFVVKSEPSSFLQHCCRWLLPPLILNGRTTDLHWLSTVACEPVAVIARKHFVPIFAVCMALHCSKKSNKDDATAVLRSSILQIAEISEDERDGLIKKHMVSIICYLLSLCSSASDTLMPFFPVQTIVLGIRTIVDGFLEIDDLPGGNTVVDKINMFRWDRVFMFLLDIHYQITGAVHSRHRCHKLAAIEVLINVLGERATIPSTFCYLLNLVGQFIGTKALQGQCCLILSTLLGVVKSMTTKETFNTLGKQLQFLVSKLVACCIPSKDSKEVPAIQSSGVVMLLHQLTVDADPSLYDYIKELEPFPELVCFERIRVFHQQICKNYSPKNHLQKFVCNTGSLSHKFLLWSLQTLHKKLREGEFIQLKKDGKVFNSWCSEPEIVSAVWMLVGMCGRYDSEDIRDLVANFVSRIGIGDPHDVVFRLPDDSSQKCSLQIFEDEAGVGFSDKVLIDLLLLLKSYLMDDSVKIIDMTSRALQGILSTERGQCALRSFDCFERSLLEVHSKGVNLEIVERLIVDAGMKSKETVISLEDCSLWRTNGKTYERWLCPLVHSFISHTDDMFLRLCQDIVLMKAEVAELLFPVVLANLAIRKELGLNIRQLISSQVQDYIFTESNQLLKSIQLILNALNVLRICNITEKLNTTVQTKREGPKLSKPSTCSSKSHFTVERSKGTLPSSNTGNLSRTSEKVYWLSIDYLVAAKAAIHCGSYFTAVMYLEHWCEDNFNGLTIGDPDFSIHEMLPPHVELLVTAVKQINEPDGIYGIIQSHKLSSQSITYEHEGNWSKAIECHDLLVRATSVEQVSHLSQARELSGTGSELRAQEACEPKAMAPILQKLMDNQNSYKGLMRCLQQNGCTHILDVYCQGLTSHKDNFQHDPEFVELQYEAAWRAGNWDFSSANSPVDGQLFQTSHFHENLHSCLRALQDGDLKEFSAKLTDSKQELVLSICHASKESTENIYTAIIKLQILDHLGMAWDLRWRQRALDSEKSDATSKKILFEPDTPSMSQLVWLNEHWDFILERTQFHLNLLEPFIAFRRVLLQALNCKDCTMQHLLQSASTLRKGSRLSQALAALHELKSLSFGTERQQMGSFVCALGRLEEAKLLRAQGQQEMAINLAKYILDHYVMKDEISNVYRLVGKWLAETRSSNSRTILEQYMKQAVELVKKNKGKDKKSGDRKCQAYFHLAHYADALFRSYEERLSSNEWQAAMRLRRHKTKELEALIRRLKSSAKGEKNDYSVKIQELQKQLTMDKEEAERLQDDRDHFLDVALAGYQQCLVVGEKYDLRVVFRLVSLWFSLSSRTNVVNSILGAVKEVQSYKFLSLVYQIASRIGSSKDGNGSQSFQYALVSLVKKMAIDHPYHTIFQLLALANGDRVKDKQRSRNSFVVDMDKKYAAENMLNELSSYHGSRITQMRQMVETYIKLAELETRKEDTNKKITLPREIRCLQELELVPVVTATLPVDHSCKYLEGSFPHFTSLLDSVTIMNGINAPKVVECFGSDGKKYRQLAKSGNDDLRQDAVMEQFFGLVNTFLLNHRDTWKRRLRIRTYKVVPFTPSAGVLEWVDGTIPLGEYLLGSHRNGGAHGRYGFGDWSFLQCREYMTSEKDKRKAFEKVCDNFRPVMHNFFLERYLQPALWFEKRLSYTRSVAASSMVGYIVGLGDRHSMNILIDQATAEVVHIDLGVAFEQGLMLKTPERVPFRLTRDIIDGMGVTGVEGVFRRCCEETLSVMRTNKEALLTIIEVFIHDPLYKWALSPLKALQRQKEMDDDIDSSLEDSQDVYEGNKDAARALMRVKQKLDGYEEGEMRSVQGQVQQLIQNAVDADKLCQMFPGWGAWL